MATNNDEKTVSNVEKEKKKKKIGGLKITVPRKKSTSIAKNRKISRKGGLPSFGRQVTRASSKPTTTAPESNQVHEDDPTNDAADYDSIACDTLQAFSWIVQKQQCLYIPLNSGQSIPSVLESQLYDKLEGTTGDSIVTKELIELGHANKLHRLVPSSSSHSDGGATSSAANVRGIVAWVETRQLQKAFWDAHRHTERANPKVTSWFVSNLLHWNRRTLTRDHLAQYWNEKTISIDTAIDQLLDMRILLPQNSNHYILWVPLWGIVLGALDKAQKKLLVNLKRSQYKELSLRSIKSASYAGGLSGQFVLHTLLHSSSQQVELVNRPSGEFAKLVVRKGKL